MHPRDNAELFALVIGGYGLLGVVVDLEVAMADNVLLRPTRELMPAERLGPRMAARHRGQDATIRMAYGRLAIDTAPLPARGPARHVPAGGRRAAARPVRRPRERGLPRDVPRADRLRHAKRARWYAETVTAPRMMSGVASRNTLLNEPVANLAGRDPKRTDILHEYFLPPENLEGFLAACRAAIPGSRQDLLNVTLRYVQEDRQSVLAYARGTRIAAVMLFSQRPRARTTRTWLP